MIPFITIIQILNEFDKNRAEKMKIDETNIVYYFS